MSLTAGTRLGAYEVLGLIGAGGMGEVYRARDPKLQREVAIKILPAAFATDPDRLARFEREAHVLASLNHPNIATIHGFESADGLHALVLELVDGPTLADRIAQGPIPIDEALPIARQIAGALEAAHEHGVVHRDLKPANIKLRPDGTVKVLDFGLAKALDAVSSGSSAVSMSPTITSPALMTGGAMILGTAAYMSPEQARGKVVDRRADIWAFGCVLFEMLTGKRAFEDEDVSLTLSKVLRVEAELGLLPADVPPHVVQTIRVCLQKDPARRARDMHDVRLALDGAFASASVFGAPAAAAMPEPTRRRFFAIVAAAMAATLIVAGAVAWWAWPRPQSPDVVRFDYDLPAGQVFRRAARPVVAFSPDGRSIVYNTSQGLYLRSMGELEARLIPGTEEDLANPFFSPDGQSVAYWTADEQLKRIAISGGAPVVIAKMSIPLGASWSEDGTILLAQPEGIVRVPATGGTPELVIRAADGEVLQGPSLLPDGDAVLFSVTRAAGIDRWNQAAIVVQSLSSGERRELVKGGADATYVPTGHLVYALNDGLFAIGFDADGATVSGGPIPLAQGILRAVATGSGNYGISGNGTLVHVRGGAASLRTLAWIARDGRREDLPLEPSNYVYPRISPDGTRIALDDRNAENDVWIWNVARGTRTRLVIGEAGGQYAVWSADSTRVLFDPLSGDIHAKAASNVGQVEVIAKGVGGPAGRSPSPYFLTPSGTELVFRDQQNPTTNDDILIVSLKDGGAARPLLNGPYIERNAELSPDGRWMAYESNESGRFEVYVRPFPNVDDDRVQISNAGGMKPLWSRDGRELFYLEPAESLPRLISVAVATRGAAFSPGARTRLLDWPFLSVGEGRTYDISPDGKRFLGIVEGTSQGRVTQQIVVVEHWVEELKRLAGN